jgi:two-component system sensor histidine kinase KdpD
MVLHMARKRAQEKGCVWRAVYIESSATGPYAGQEDAQERLLRILTLAEQMGAEISYLQEATVEKGVEAMLEAEKDRIALLVIGASEREQRPWRVRPSVARRVIRVAQRYTEVEIIPLASEVSGGQSGWETLRMRLRSVKLLHLLWGLAAVGVAYLASELMRWLLPPALFRINMQNVDLLFMIACAFVAGRYGLLPGLMASAASFIIVDYDFTPSYHNFTFISVTDALNVTIFLFAALFISIFTSRTRSYAENAFRRENTAQALFTLYRIASDSSSRQQALEKLQRKLEGMLETEVAFFLPPALNPVGIAAAFPPDLALGEADQRALEMCWMETKTTGLASPFHPGGHWRFEPMIAPGGPLGVLGVRPRQKTKLDAWFGRLLTAIANQTAAVLERIELGRSMEATRIREEREKLRSMLLSSVSHDLKTPLSAIIGSLSVYRSLGERLTQAKQGELIETALEEAQRLDSFITNILDMTRLESGRIELKPEWQDMPTLLQQVSKRLQTRLRHHRLQIHPVPPNLEIYMDVMMTGQVLQNIIDNACKYTHSGTMIEITCLAQEGRDFLCEVRDHGAGLQPEDMERIFDKYARLQKEDTRVAGTGLGLSICKAIMEMQGGAITVGNHPEGGAVFTLRLPRWRVAESQKYVA